MCDAPIGGALRHPLLLLGSLPDVGIVVVGDILHCEDLAVFLGLLVFRPERGVGLKIGNSISFFHKDFPHSKAGLSQES